MVVIFQGKEFWIEFLQGATQAAVAANGQYQQQVQLQKPGVFLGGALYFSSLTVTTDVGGARLLNAGDGQITLGDFLTEIRLSGRNGATIQAITMQGFVCLRKRRG